MNSVLHSSSTNVILTHVTVFFIYNTHICKQPRCCSPSRSMMMYWSPVASWDRKLSIDEHSRIWAEAEGHPGTPRLLFYEYWCFGHTCSLAYCFPLLYSREVGVSDAASDRTEFLFLSVMFFSVTWSHSPPKSDTKAAIKRFTVFFLFDPSTKQTLCVTIFRERWHFWEQHHWQTKSVQTLSSFFISIL